MRLSPLATLRAQRSAVAALLLVVALPLAASAQARRDAFKGRVTTDSGAAITGADVIVTLAPTTESFRTTTDSSGRYQLALTNGTGEYVLYVGAAGRKPFRKRFTVTGPDSTFTVDVSLASSVQVMAQVAVKATTPRPYAPSAFSEGSAGSGMDRSTQTIRGAVSPDMATNIEALAATIPGLGTAGGGISAFGLGAAGNSTTLNGLAVSGADLPRDVSRGLRFATSPWDPSHGGFAGVEAALSLNSGTNVPTRTAHLRVDHPSLQFSDAIADRAGQRFADFGLSAGGAGPIELDALYYNLGAQLSRRTTPVTSLINADAALLGAAGVSADSASRLLQLLAVQRIPLAGAGNQTARVTTSASFAAQIDHELPSGPRGSIPRPTWSITGVWAASESESSGLSATSTPGTTGRGSNMNAALQGNYVRYIGEKGTVVSKTVSGLSLVRRENSPELTLPSGVALVASALSDGSSALGALAFGGSGAASSRATTWSWETTQQWDWLFGGIANRETRFYLQSRLEGFDQQAGPSNFGTFTYPSLSALAANTPSGFSRTLRLPSVNGGEWTGAASLGGNWTLGKWRLTGGGRLDGNVFTASPTANPSVATALGDATSGTPSTVGFSPRFGFSRELGGQRGSMAYVSDLSTILESSGTVRGGLGLFRAAPSVDLLSGAMAATGLPGGTQRLSCVGAAVPTPDWAGYSVDQSRIPSSCVGGSAFVDTIPNVSLFDPSYRPLQSWRGTLGITRTVFNTYITLDAIFARHMYRSSVIDLNFAGTPRFQLSDEASRPVYVAPGSIAPGSGLTTGADARRVATFGRVLERRSDLTGTARQLTAYVVPNIPFKIGQLTIGYTWQDARSEMRGFDQSTAGDPRSREEMTTPYAPRHSFLIQYAKLFGKVWGFTTFMRASSGVAFTPMVSGDINGDGISNDRAFVFDPAKATDPALASSMRSLLTSAPSWARECLTGQMGTVAGGNSCTGPWTTTMNASVYLLGALPGSAGRGRLTLSLVNVPGAADLLLHGSAGLRGWGAQSAPDQTLLRVRGFDPVARRYQYDVNSRFGATSAATTTDRLPFRIVLDYSLDLGPDQEAEWLDLNLRIRAPLKGTRAPADSITKRYLGSGFGNFYPYLIRVQADSIALSTDQLRTMQARSDALDQRAKALYVQLGVELAALPPKYDPKAVLARIKRTGDEAWAMVEEEKDALRSILNPAQIRRLPTRMFQWMTDPKFNGRFYFGGY